MKNYLKYLVGIFGVILIAFIALQLSAKNSSPTTTSTSISAITSITGASTTVISSSSSTQTTTVQAPVYNASFITYNPFNLSQISSISRFRSCAGHDVSGLDVNGTLEPFSSMKHYLQPKSQFASATGKLPIFSPFQGWVSAVFPTNPLRGLEPDLQGNSSGGWMVIIYHVDPLSFIKNNTIVTPGEFLGYANLINGSDFDIAVERLPTGWYQKTDKLRNNISTNFSKLQNQYRTNLTLDNMFSHMTPNVSAQYQKFGASLSNAVISLSYRQANPCTCIGATQFGCHFLPTQRSNDYVNLTTR